MEKTLQSIGALCGVASLLWNLFTWFRDSPRLRVRYICNQVLIPHLSVYVKESIAKNMPEYKPKSSTDLCFSITITNVGKRPTTLDLIYFETYWGKYPPIKEEDTSYLPRNSPLCTASLPYILKPGELWEGIFVQPNHLINSLPPHTRAFLNISHSYEETPHKILFKPDRSWVSNWECMHAEETAFERSFPDLNFPKSHYPKEKPQIIEECMKAEAVALERSFNS